MELIGKVIKLTPKIDIYENKTDKPPFYKRELILGVDLHSPYPNYIPMVAIQDKCDLLNNVKEGDDVKVYFTIKGREWRDKEGKTKYFIELAIFKLDLLKSASVPSQPNKDNSDEFPF